MKIGIDLGTSYSSIAAEINGKIEMIKVSTGASAFGDSFSMPTAVYVDNGQALLGQAALGKRKMSPQCFKNEFKRDFGTTTPYVLSGEEYLPEQLYTEVFLYFKEQAVKQTGEKVERVYLTHPANYGNNKKRLLEKAANNAGLFDVVLVDEPTAAAAGYSQKNKIVDGDILLVYDLGGGTFDVALIKKTEKGYVHLAEPLGISQCGGIDFDRVIFEDIIKKMGEKGEFDTERLLKERRFTAALSEVCIQIKHQLSQAQSHTEPIAVGAYDYFEYTITRQEFEDMIRPLVSNTCEKVKDILKNSGLVASDIDRVLLVGGSSRVPLVQKMVCDTLNKEASFDADPELAVCQGAVSLGFAQKKDDISKKEEDQNIKEGLTQKVEDRVYGSNEIEIKNMQIEKLLGILKYAASQKSDNQKEKKIPKISIGDLEKKKQIEKFLGILKYAVSQKGDNLNEKKILKINIETHERTKQESREDSLSSEYMNELLLGVKCGIYPYDGRWIYYSREDNKKAIVTINRVRTDGTQNTMLIKYSNKESIRDIQLKDQWVYYLRTERMEGRGGYYKLYRINKEGMGETIIYNKNGVDQYIFDKDWMGDCIYLNLGQSEFCMIRLNGQGYTRIIYNSQSLNFMTIKDEWIYYIGDILIHKLYRIRKDGTGKTNIAVCPGRNMAILDDWIFYENSYSGKLCKMRINGTGNCTVIDRPVKDIKVIDKWVYFYNYNLKSYYRVRSDGTGLEAVK